MRKQWTTSVLAVLAVTLSGCGYNRIQTLDEQANAFKSQIEVQLQRRADLVPNLVETVRGYAQQEQTIFTAVADARARLGGAVQSGNLGQMAEACGMKPLDVLDVREGEVKRGEHWPRVRDFVARLIGRVQAAA